MKCSHLVKLLEQSSVYCNAGDKTYAPSPFQLKEYCRSSSHKKCPFRLESRSKDQEELLLKYSRICEQSSIY